MYKSTCELHNIIMIIGFLMKLDHLIGLYDSNVNLIGALRRLPSAQNQVKKNYVITKFVYGPGAVFD